MKPSSIICSAFFLYNVCSFAAVLYVDVNSATPVSPYASWSTAAINIQDAVDVAVPGDLMLVTNGTYDVGGRAVAGGTTNHVAVTNAITIRSMNGPSVTAIAGYQVPGATNGPDSVRCAYLASGAILDGFTLKNGATQDQNTGLDLSGGGVFCESRDARLTNCVLTGNVAFGQAGGIDSGSLDHCWLSNNLAATASGGGAHGSALNTCLVVSNRAGYGGGADVCILSNCVVVGNFAFVRRSGSGIGGGTSGGLAYNTIIYYNDSASGDEPNMSFSGLYRFCCSTPNPNLFGITNEPAFVDLAGGNFRLQSNSPCINSGASLYTPAGPDLDGNSRVSGGCADIGAYEFQNPSSTISYAWLSANGFPTDGSADFADPDGDHMDNWREWIAGTDPHDSSSLLRMYNPAPGNDGTVLLSWQSVPNRTYFLERSTNGPQGPFIPFAGNLFSFPPTNQYLDYPPADANAVFYRVWTDPQRFTLP